MKAEKDKESFKEYLKDTLIKHLKGHDNCFTKKPDENIEIANIHFAYNNEVVIRLLQTRGRLIANAEYLELV